MMRKRLRVWLFWKIEGFEDWLLDKPWCRDWMFNGQQAACWLLRRHEPISMCHEPAHDSCAWCRMPMPGQAPLPNTVTKPGVTLAEDVASRITPPPGPHSPPVPPNYRPYA